MRRTSTAKPKRTVDLPESVLTAYQRSNHQLPWPEYRACRQIVRIDAHRERKTLRYLLRYLLEVPSGIAPKGTDDAIRTLEAAGFTPYASAHASTLTTTSQEQT